MYHYSHNLMFELYFYYFTNILTVQSNEEVANIISHVTFYQEIDIIFNE